MTGPEHYQQAENLMTEYEAIVENGGDPGDMLQAAQIHATLALAAATAMGAPVDGEADSGLPPRDAKAWYDAAGVKAEQQAGGASA
ncbi:hypothetical protein ABZ883_14590 [Streptomyces sp. NPDC046977]|uniref:hypothetical protein n=1 Tax=Streptomyces sp. NPDC046977 TaxID=3154703 RepID=UPI0033FCFE77